MSLNKSPKPNEIDNDWIVRHDWILNRVLLDDSFRPALSYISTRITGDEYALKQLSNTLCYCRPASPRIALADEGRDAGHSLPRGGELGRARAERRARSCCQELAAGPLHEVESYGSAVQRERDYLRVARVCLNRRPRMSATSPKPSGTRTAPPKIRKIGIA